MATWVMLDGTSDKESVYACRRLSSCKSSKDVVQIPGQGGFYKENILKTVCLRAPKNACKYVNIALIGSKDNIIIGGDKAVDLGLISA